MSKPTINDVAAAAGVSRKTVSRALAHAPDINEETRARIERVIEELGYVPAAKSREATAPAQSGVIVLLHDNSDPELLLVAHRGVFEAIRDTAYILAIRPVDPGSPSAVEDLQRFLAAQRPAGVVLLPGVAEQQAIVAACTASGFPFAQISGARLTGPAAITSNDREAAAIAIDHLVELGHERIGLVSGPEEGAWQQRELGYLDAMADHELDRGPALIATGDLSFESGVAAGNLLLEVSPRPTAIFAINDAMAAGVMHAAHARKIAVPAQLSVLGFGDTPIAAHIWPPLTTVHVPIAAMTCGAVFKMIYPDQAAELPSHFTLEYVERASVASAG